MKQKDMHVLKRVAEAWDAAMGGLTKMSQSATTKPATGYEIFRLDATAPADVIKLEFGPVALNLPERARDSSSLNIFVVLTGWLSIEPPNTGDGKLLTRSFSTEVGYFRLKNGVLHHVYGAHYDMDEEHKGHPVFHSQFTSQTAFSADVNTLFRMEEGVQDHVNDVLKNVRTPSAQMDVFSVLLQLCADHLMWEKSSDETLQAFQQIRDSCEFMIGAATRLEYLNSPPGSTCYRGPHWYKSPAANA